MSIAEHRTGVCTGLEEYLRTLTYSGTEDKEKDKDKEVLSAFFTSAFIRCKESDQLSSRHFMP